MLGTKAPFQLLIQKLTFQRMANIYPRLLNLSGPHFILGPQCCPVDSSICSRWNQPPRDLVTSARFTLLLIPELPWTSRFSLEGNTDSFGSCAVGHSVHAQKHPSLGREQTITWCSIIFQVLVGVRAEVSEERQFLCSIVYKMHNLFLYIYLHLVHTQLLNIFPKNRNMTHFHNFWIIEIFSKTENIASF